MKGIQKYAAEFIAVFSLTLAVSFSLIFGDNFSIITPAAAGLTLGLFVYTVGAISGAHVNPAITIGLALNGKHSARDTIGYLIAQFLGAATVLYTLKAVGLAVDVTAANTYDIGLIEMLGTFFLGFGVASAVWGKVTSSASGLVVGSSLFLGIILAAAAGSNGVLNPAVAFGIGSFNVYYLVGPILGATLAMTLYRGINQK